LVGDEALAPVAAEVLAQYGEEGEALLSEAIVSDDMMTRRAAVFGLVEVGARDLLERAAREDDQWLVRSLASAAVEELESREKGGGVAPSVEIEQIPWLISWAASRGEGVGLGEAAREMLLRALSEGDAPVRLAAALTLAQEGRTEDVELLKTALADPDPEVASAALDALAEISRRYDLRIG
jgi:HEAT repeat protein